MRLFISYRRQDTEGYVGALSSILEGSGITPPVELFVDADKIPTGTDFVQRMLSAVTSCDAVLACIGPAWRGNVPGSTKVRLFADDDPVRVELATALPERPVFIGLFAGASRPVRKDLPDDLAELIHADTTTVSDGRFPDDVVALVKRIRDKVRPPDRAPLEPAKIGMSVPPGKYLSSVELLIDGRSAGRFFPKPDRVAEFVVTPGSHTV